jgi:hypothetical protein
MANKREVSDIDESLLLSSIREQDTQKEAVEEVTVQEPQQVREAEPLETAAEKPKDVKEPVKRKRNTNMDYRTVFLQKHELKNRQCVYIGREIHATLSEIVRVIADRDITVGGYIDCILSEHTEAHRDEINELYRRELSRKDKAGLIE